jgi:hypothetical protein
MLSGHGRKEAVMAKIVGAEERDKLTGLLLEYFRQIRQKGGYPYDVNRLTAFLQEGIEGRFWSGLFDDIIRRHKLSRAELYQIICMNGSRFFEAINDIVNTRGQSANLTVQKSQTADNIVHFVLSSVLTLPSWAKGVAEGEDYEAAFAGREVEFELVKFLNSGEPYVNGEEMLKRSLARTRPAGNRAFEDFANHPELIPDEWQKYVLVFPGAVLLDEFGNRYIRDLIFDSGQWDRCADWLGYYFGSDYRVVGFRK